MCQLYFSKNRQQDKLLETANAGKRKFLIKQPNNNDTLLKDDLWIKQWLETSKATE